MLSNTRWKVTHLATWYAQKLTHLETFKTDQMSGSKMLMSKINRAKAPILRTIVDP